jgi:hypothetical protein
MKSLSIRLAVFAATTVLICTSFRTAQERSFPQAKAKHKVFFYWYYANDTYDQYTSPVNEEDQLKEITGDLVNDDPTGGVLEANGYGDNSFPHDEQPSVVLYAHPN